MAAAMFTGLIEAVGAVVSAERKGSSLRLRVDLGPAAEGVRPGDSIALAGCCLTVAALAGRVADFDSVAETLARTTLGRWRPGTRVNLERGLRPGDRLGGHFVAAHVDATGTVLSSGARPDGWWLRVEAPPALLPEIAPKGSIAVDGVSLTVVEAEGAAFSVALVPHTLQQTTLGLLRAGDPVNLETDLLAKYVRRAIAALGSGHAGDERLLDALRRAGFVE
jgi:riboflavin synthase alpha subunit